MRQTKLIFPIEKRKYCNLKISIVTQVLRSVNNSGFMHYLIGYLSWIIIDSARSSLFWNQILQIEWDII